MNTTTSPEMDKKTSDGADWEAWQTSFMNETFTNLRRFTSIPFPARENGASPQRRDSPGDCLRGGPAQSLPLHRRGRTQVQNAPLFRVRAGEPAVHHGSQGRPEYRGKLR